MYLKEVFGGNIWRRYLEEVSGGDIWSMYLKNVFGFLAKTQLLNNSTSKTNSTSKCI